MGSKSAACVLDTESFSGFLSWLDPDPDRAGERYTGIHRRLTRLFEGGGCLHAEELADETMMRVIRQAPGVVACYRGDPLRYVYGVARNVRREYYRWQTRSRACLRRGVACPEP